MDILFPTHLLEARDLLSLGFTHLCKLLDSVVGAGELLPEHLVIPLDILCHGSLPIDLDVERAQVL